MTIPFFFFTRVGERSVGCDVGTLPTIIRKGFAQTSTTVVRYGSCASYFLRGWVLLKEVLGGSVQLSPRCGGDMCALFCCVGKGKGKRECALVLCLILAAVSL